MGRWLLVLVTLENEVTAVVVNNSTVSFLASSFFSLLSTHGKLFEDEMFLGFLLLTFIFV